MFVLTLTDDKLLKFVLIWGKVVLRLFGGEKLGCPRTPFIILLALLLHTQFMSQCHAMSCTERAHQERHLNT